MLFRFVWISDMHLEVVPYNPPYTYADGEPEMTVEYISTLGASFIIDTGDVAAVPLIENYELYENMMSGLGIPVYSVIGNHDEHSGGTWPEWEQVLGSPRFSFTEGDFAFIGVAAREWSDFHGYMPQDELDFLEVELKAAGSLHKLVFAHYPIIADFHPAATILENEGGIETLELLQGHSALTWCSGHIHSPCQGILQNDIYHINGDAMVPPKSDDHDNGMMICDVFVDRIEIDYVRGSAPWDSYGPNDNPTDHDPNYDPVIIQWQVCMEEDEEQPAEPNDQQRPHKGWKGASFLVPGEYRF